MPLNDPRFARMYDRVKEYAQKDGVTDDELASPALDRLSHQTGSPRIIRMIRLAYYLGWLRGIRHYDEMQVRVVPTASVPDKN